MHGSHWDFAALTIWFQLFWSQKQLFNSFFTTYDNLFNSHLFEKARWVIWIRPMTKSTKWIVKLIQMQRKVYFCMWSSNTGDSVADPVPIKMCHKKVITLTYFLCVENRQCVSHCMWNLVTRCQRGGGGEGWGLISFFSFALCGIGQ